MPLSNKIQKSDGLPCSYCGCTMRTTFIRPDVLAPEFPTRDHVVPKCMNGSKTVMVCFACNQEKGSIPISEWYARLRRVADSRATKVLDVISALSGMSWDMAIDEIVD